MSYIRSFNDLEFFNNTNEMCIINRGMYHYPYFNVSMMKCLASLGLRSLYLGAFPYFELEDRKPGDFEWGDFFEQPFSVNFDNVKIKKTKCDINNYEIYPYHTSVYNKSEVKMWSKVFSIIFKFNAKTKEYLQQDYNNTIGSREKVLGVVYRGTDYITLQPKGHPVQPTIDQLLNYVELKFMELGCEYIYLASEEQKVVEVFKEKFQGIVITNERLYYDEQYYNNNFITHISQVKLFEEDDNYKKGITYLSSINILSKCYALIGGNCGASQAALYLNNMKYAFYDLLDMGLY